jgi:hypothetical protein
VQLEQYNEDPRVGDLAADLKFLIEIAEKILSGQRLSAYATAEQAEHILQAADIIRQASRGTELDALCVPHRLVADFVYRYVYSCNLEVRELETRARLLELLENGIHAVRFYC